MLAAMVQGGPNVATQEWQEQLPALEMATIMDRLQCMYGLQLLAVQSLPVR